ncbi:MAG: Nudix family hydrolase [Pseudomonadota bacterium]|nr:Nudix family hydrolase [Pseudomonadota bacterium]
MKRIHVVAAVIERQGKILIARRPDHLHQGGKWEFPGGKVEPGEAVTSALRRELQEELGIEVVERSPLITIAHDYPDKQVLLDVWRVTGFNGEARGMEGQEICWVTGEQLPQYEFPAANVPIVAAARLPSVYVISPELGGSMEDFVDSLHRVLERGVRLLQLRLKTIEEDCLQGLLSQVDALRARYGAVVLVNSDMPVAVWSRLDGVHLTAAHLHQIQERPAGARWVAASCHNDEDIRRAERLGVDFVTLSPYRKTLSHPEASPLDVGDFARWVAAAKLPVYALGGLTPTDEASVQALGAQGAAGIRGFWGQASG